MPDPTSWGVFVVASVVLLPQQRNGHDADRATAA
jgi:hypothetical protein